ncbi:MAG: hypothetical protein E7453_05780 [Ruminococcaceae bacterium]|nr:hypothetical protein [Oscillospiraceae bacterium]
MKSFIRCCALLCCTAMMMTGAGCSVLEAFMGNKPEPTQPPEEQIPVKMVWEVPEEIVLVADNAAYGSAPCEWKVYADEKDVSDQVTVSVEDTAVAAFENGVATAVGRGNTFLTVSYESETKKIPVYVLGAQEGYDLSDSKSVRTFGRTYMEDGTLCIPNVASGFEVSFIGTSLQANLSAIAPTLTGTVKVYVDGEFTKYLNYPADFDRVDLCKDLEEGFHTVKVLKMTEQGYLRVRLSELKTDGTALTAFPSSDLRFEFYGDSITSGFGNLGITSQFKECEDGTQTYATMLGEYFGADCDMISYAGVPACLPVDHSHLLMGQFFDKVDAASNLPYDFEANPVDLVVINLGTNDAGSAEKTVSNMAEGYADLLRSIRAKRPGVPILCVYGMMGVDGDIDAGINRAIDDVLSEGETDIYYLWLFSDTSGYKGHPKVAVGHTNAFEEMKTYILDRNLLEK